MDEHTAQWGQARPSRRNGSTRSSTIGLIASASASLPGTGRPSRSTMTQRFGTISTSARSKSNSCGSKLTRCRASSAVSNRRRIDRSTCCWPSGGFATASCRVEAAASEAAPWPPRLALSSGSAGGIKLQASSTGTSIIAHLSNTTSLASPISRCPKLVFHPTSDLPPAATTARGSAAAGLAEEGLEATRQLKSPAKAARRASAVASKRMRTACSTKSCEVLRSATDIALILRATRAATTPLPASTTSVAAADKA
mmetsp:Transcript_54934/g.158008  ORF Transcript_54934/g.158008 Transcript_54934/m.158008 type:complete len:255 (-) Transcript_54934:220-984(-)